MILTLQGFFTIELPYVYHQEIDFYLFVADNFNPAKHCKTLFIQIKEVIKASNILKTYPQTYPII